MDYMFFEGVPTYVRDYLYYIKNVRSLSKRTVNAYYTDLLTFFKFIASYKQLTEKENFHEIDGSIVSIEILKQITLSDLYLFLNFVTDEHHNTARTRARKISSLRGFYKYMDKQAILNENPTKYLETPKTHVSLPVYLSFDECVKLLNSIDGPNKERDLCIITLFLHCGLRLSELEGLNLNDITDNRMKVLGKGNKERELFLNESCIAALSNYKKVRTKAIPKTGHENALFLSRHGTRISNRMIQTLVKKFIQKAGLDTEKYSTHKLRHTAATLMFQSGADIRVLQDVLGHVNLGTTQIYTHVKNEQVEEAITKNPLNKINKADH